MSETVQEQNETEAQPAPSLTLQDLITTAQLIQQTVARGAVRAEEMEVIGGLYNRIVVFLDASGAVTRPSEPDAPSEDTPSEDTPSEE